MDYNPDLYADKMGLNWGFFCMRRVKKPLFLGLSLWFSLLCDDWMSGSWRSLVEERLARLSMLDDQLEAFSRNVDFEMFHPELNKALPIQTEAKAVILGLTQ